MHGKLFVVSGPSGVGKGTICQKLLKRREDIYFSISCTTRAIRPGEIDGVHYHFITEDAFLRMRDSGGLLECSHHALAWYGTPRAAALEHMALGTNVLLEIENNGAQQVIQTYPETIGVFVLPPSRESLIRRLVGRKTESLDKLRDRVAKVPSELVAARRYTYRIVNDDADAAARHLNDIFDGVYEEPTQNARLLDSLDSQFSDMEDVYRALTEIYREV